MNHKTIFLNRVYEFIGIGPLKREERERWGREGEREMRREWNIGEGKRVWRERGRGTKEEDD